MNVSYNWLAKYVDLNCSVEDLADKMTMAGIEVEAIDKVGMIPNGIVVGEILERNPHPDAEKLSVCKVSDGNEELQIVCGAPNCDADKKVPLATIGTVFPPEEEGGKEFKIKKSKLRGVPSFGMLCSCDELGLAGDTTGLMELPADFEVGKPLGEVLQVGDTVYEIEVTPNRPDWLSHWGVARDVAALLDCPSQLPEINEPAPTKTEDVTNVVTVEDNDLCPRYTARIIRNVTVKESPMWLQEQLTAIGLRPINNIVDITNYVLYELGNPLHAFDLNELTENKIVVRRAKDKEKIVTLDEKELELTTDNLVICDAEKPVCLAGVMGGLHSGVTEKTTDVLLEGAVFFSSNIRSTASKLKISSDSSYRYERGVDWNGAKLASDRATQMILDIAGGELVTELVDINTGEPEMPKIDFNFERCRKLLGIYDLSNETMINIFERLRLNVTEITDESCVVIPPTFRLDLYRQADLDEEIARIYGLDKVPMKPVEAVGCDNFSNDAYFKQETARNQLIGLGLNECMNYSMISTESALKDARFTKDDLVKISNPLNLDFAVMRPSLFGEMLNSVERNISHRNLNLALFECGRVFCANEKLYSEERMEVCIALTGQRHAEQFSNELEVAYDIYDLKGLVDSFFEMRKITGYRYQLIEDAKFAKGFALEIIMHNRSIGQLGVLSKKLSKGFKTSYPVMFAILDLDPIIKLKEKKLTYQEISQYPATTRDIAFTANESLQHNDVINFISKCKLKNLESVALFDIFRDEKVIGEGKKSMAYNLTFRGSNKTLTDKEVNNAYEKLRSQMAKNLPIELR
ncbi:phenylalanine--tRNA ligase subunit beta [Lentisphaerota bacterium WC36G]|nr:phenylalanine--tRNA ligase subunit beta [Lentisphaerae bacterium WC36]